jgi:arylsulfatase
MAARQMEVYAGFIEQTDHHVGRVLDFIESLGELDNTIVIVLSDNGASAEGGVHGTFNEVLFFNGVAETLEGNLPHYDAWGGPDTYPHYSWGWTWAGNTPFRRWKRETYRGGVTDPLIVSWPTGISGAGDVRHQYAHVTDIAPTILDVLGVEPPGTIRGVPQSEIHGVSFAHTFTDASAATNHHTQYFEMFGSRAIYDEGWKANCPFPGPSFAEAAETGRYFGMQLTAELLTELDESGWELYRLEDDPTETRDLAADEPERLRDMIALWYREADTYGVFPLAGAGASRLLTPRPTIASSRERQVWYPDAAPVYFGAAPKPYNRPYSITAEVTIPPDGAEGVIVNHGSRHGGYAMLVQDGRLHHVLNYLALARFVVSAVEPLPTGDMTLRYEFVPTGPPRFREGLGPPGHSMLYVDDRLVGAIELPYSTPNRIGPVGFSCGYAAFDSVDPDRYRAPFRFTGTIHRVVIDVSGDELLHDEAEFRRLMAEQ